MRSLRQFGIFLNPYYWKTARLIAGSNMSKQYRNSFLGMLWTLIQPLSTIFVYALIMPLIMKFPVKNYVLYVVCTLPIWNFIASSLLTSCNSLISQAETLKRCMISSTVFPVADVIKCAYIYCISFGTMYACLVLVGFPVSWYVLLLPLYLLPTLFCVMAVCVGIAFVAPYVRDIGEALTVTLTMMVWFSAVLFPTEILPGWAQQVVAWNPFYILMQPAISIVYHQTLPDMAMMARLGLMCLLSLGFGYTLYKRCRHNFVYYL